MRVQGGDEALKNEVTYCVEVTPIFGPRRVDKLEEFLRVIGRRCWRKAQIGARCQGICGSTNQGHLTCPNNQQRVVGSYQEPYSVEADVGLAPALGAAVALWDTRSDKSSDESLMMWCPRDLSR